MKHQPSQAAMSGPIATNEQIITNLRSACTAKDAELTTLRAQVAGLEVALSDVVALVHHLPSGVDESADPEDDSPEDMNAHIGGLILQRCRAASAVKEPA